MVVQKSEHSRTEDSESSSLVVCLLGAAGVRSMRCCFVFGPRLLIVTSTAGLISRLVTHTLIPNGSVPWPSVHQCASWGADVD